MNVTKRYFERRNTRVLAASILSLLAIYGIIGLISGNGYINQKNPYIIGVLIISAWGIGAYMMFQYPYEVPAQVVGGVGIVVTGYYFDPLFSADADPALIIIGTILPTVYLGLTILDTYRYLNGSLITHYQALG